jgi:hypothetical protein
VESSAVIPTSRFLSSTTPHLLANGLALLFRIIQEKLFIPSSLTTRFKHNHLPSPFSVWNNLLSCLPALTAASPSVYFQHRSQGNPIRMTVNSSLSSAQNGPGFPILVKAKVPTTLGPVLSILPTHFPICLTFNFCSSPLSHSIPAHCPLH